MSEKLNSDEQIQDNGELNEWEEMAKNAPEFMGSGSKGLETHAGPDATPMGVTEAPEGRRIVSADGEYIPETPMPGEVEPAPAEEFDNLYAKGPNPNSRYEMNDYAQKNAFESYEGLASALKDSPEMASTIAMVAGIPGVEDIHSLAALNDFADELHNKSPEDFDKFMTATSDFINNFANGGKIVENTIRAGDHYQSTFAYRSNVGSEVGVDRDVVCSSDVQIVDIINEGGDSLFNSDEAKMRIREMFGLSSKSDFTAGWSTRDGQVVVRMNAIPHIPDTPDTPDTPDIPDATPTPTPDEVLPPESRANPNSRYEMIDHTHHSPEELAERFKNAEVEEYRQKAEKESGKRVEFSKKKRDGIFKSILRNR